MLTASFVTGTIPAEDLRVSHKQKTVSPNYKLLGMHVHVSLSTLCQISDVNHVLKGFTKQDSIHEWSLHNTLWTWEISSGMTVFDLQCLDRHIKIIKGFKVNVFAFEELCFSPSGPPSLVPLPHFLTLVFSSSPFSRLPQSLEFAAGQKAAAEAQPIWNAAPPFWRSEGKKARDWL